MGKNFKYTNYIKYILIIMAILVCGTIYAIGSLCRRTDEGNDFQTLCVTDTTAVVGTDEQDSEFSETTASNESDIYIYVCGCVEAPGVYTVRQQTRVYELIEMAGGFSEGADDTALNLVDIVSDGQKIYVPEKGSVLQEGDSNGQDSTGLVNLNTADKAALMTLPGIGEAKAEDILQYRKNKGAFRKIEEIKNISGIKDAAFEKIKDLICV